MRVAGLKGVESKAEILSSSWCDQYLCSYTQTVFLVIEISHSYIMLETQNKTRDPARNVTVVSQRFQPHFTKTEPQQKPVIIIKKLNYLLLITPGKMIEFYVNMTYIPCHTYSNTSSTSNNHAHVYGCQNEYFCCGVFFRSRELVKKKCECVSGGE